MRTFIAFAAAIAFLGTSGIGYPGSSKDKLSVSAMQKKAEAAVGKIRGMREAAEARLRSARKDQAMARLDCVNEGLIALKGVLKLAEDYLYDLQADAKQGNDQEVRRGLGMINIAGKKAEDLDSRIRSCGGPSEAGVVEGEPVVERYLDPDLPLEDPADLLETETLFVERPFVSSPYY